ncbi:MAG: hypothetical protein ACJAVU_002098 [Cognaticolwellia sp.]|jgi:hypothetical protein
MPLSKVGQVHIYSFSPKIAALSASIVFYREKKMIK